MIRVHETDCNLFLDETKLWFDGIFMDGPDNIGLEYSGFVDKREDYIDWLTKLILKAMAKTDVVWVSYYHKHALQLHAALNWYLSKMDWQSREILWHFTFGQYRDSDCGSCFRPILRLSRPWVKWDVDSIRVRSTRMALGDPRAAGLKVPGDVWEFPRVVGNSSERRSWHPTQHNEKLMERIYRMTPGGFGNGTIRPKHFLDLFAGSGTSGVVCKRLGYNCDLVEISSTYCKELRKMFS